MARGTGTRGRGNAPRLAGNSGTGVARGRVESVLPRTGATRRVRRGSRGLVRVRRGYLPGRRGTSLPVRRAGTGPGASGAADGARGRVRVGHRIGAGRPRNGVRGGHRPGRRVRRRRGHGSGARRRRCRHGSRGRVGHRGHGIGSGLGHGLSLGLVTPCRGSRAPPSPHTGTMPAAPVGASQPPPGRRRTAAPSGARPVGGCPGRCRFRGRPPPGRRPAWPRHRTAPPPNGPAGGRGGGRSPQRADGTAWGLRAVSPPGTGAEASEPSSTMRLAASTWTTRGTSARASASSTWA